MSHLGAVQRRQMLGRMGIRAHKATWGAAATGQMWVRHGPPCNRETVALGSVTNNNK